MSEKQKGEEPMNFNELLEMLGIEGAGEFSYFENFADLLECEEPIEYAAIFELISEVELPILKELVEGYFDDMTENMPADSVHLFTLMETIKKSFVGILALVGDQDGDVQIGLFVDEIYKFREWYLEENLASCKSIDGKKQLSLSICQSFYLHRLEKLNNEQYAYDFTDCLGYKIEEYAMVMQPFFEEEEPVGEYIYDDTEDDYGDTTMDENY